MSTNIRNFLQGKRIRFRCRRGAFPLYWDSNAFALATFSGLNVIEKFKILDLGVFGADSKNLDLAVLFFAEIKTAFVCKYDFLDRGSTFFPEHLSFYQH